MRALAACLVLTLAASLFPSHPASAAGCATPGTPTTTVYLPNITKTLGGPTGWVTPFIVQNVGTAPTTLEVAFYGFYDGALVACRTVPSLAPQTSFADVPNNDADLPDNAQFAVVVRSFGSPVVAVVNEQQGVGARAESMSYGGLTQGSTTVALPYVAKAVGGWTTTFVIQNVGAASASVTIAFASADGTKTATLTRSIAAGRSGFVDPSYEPSLVAGVEYAATITSTQPVAAVVNAQNDLPTVASPRAFSYNGAAGGVAAPMYLPSVAKNTDGIGRATRLLVQNTGATDATPSLTFQGAGGSPVVVTAPAPVKPGRAWSFDPRSQADGATPCGPAAAPGCLADGEYGFVVGGGSFAVVGTTLSAATAMGAIASASAPTRAYLPNITRTLGGSAGWTTPIVLQSAGATSAMLRWYRFADGALALTQYVPSLVPGGSVRIDPRSVPGLADGTQYAVVVDAAAPIAAGVQQMSFQGGDGTMAYEGFSATGALAAAPALSSISVAPAAAAVGLSAKQQLTATVKDQNGNVVVGVPVQWAVAPPTAGTVDASGLFTAGATATTATVTATFGSLSGSAVLTLQATSLTAGGFTFAIRATSTSDLYLEQSISTADSQTIATSIDADAAEVQTTYGRPYATRPQVYVFPTTTTYTTGLQTIIGVSAASAAISGPQTSGFFRWQSANGVVTTKLALNWQKVGAQAPMTTPRHELTHMMIAQIAKPTGSTSIPAWINEGSARLEEFTVAGTTHWQNENRYGAASMIASRDYFSVADITDQDVWNARTGDPAMYQYYEASQVAQLVRADVGTAGVVRIFDLMGQGQPFDAAFQTVTGRPTATFAAGVPARLQALSAVYPYIVTSGDTDAGAGLSYFLYGFQPYSSLTVEISGGGYHNTNPARTANAYGFVLTSYLGSGWPAGTYTFTVTGITPPSSITPGVSITFSTTAVKASSVIGAQIVP